MRDMLPIFDSFGKEGETPQRLYAHAELASELGISRQTLDALIRVGLAQPQFQATRHGQLFAADQLDHLRAMAVLLRGIHVIQPAELLTAHAVAEQLSFYVAKLPRMIRNKKIQPDFVLGNGTALFRPDRLPSLRALQLRGA